MPWCAIKSKCSRLQMPEGKVCRIHWGGDAWLMYAADSGGSRAFLSRANARKGAFARLRALNVLCACCFFHALALLRIRLPGHKITPVRPRGVHSPLSISSFLSSSVTWVYDVAHISIPRKSRKPHLGPILHEDCRRQAAGCSMRTLQ